MALKDQISQSRGETKEKIMSIQFIEKEKAMLENQIHELKKQVQFMETEKINGQTTIKQVESQLALSSQNCISLKDQMKEDK